MRSRSPLHRRAPSLRRLVALALALGLGLAGCTFRITRQDVFSYEAPRFDPARLELPAGWTLEPVASPGVALAHRLRGPATEGTLLFFHGNGGAVERVLPLLLPRVQQLNLDLVVLDYRAAGSAAPAVAEVRGAAAALFQEASASGRPVHVGGHSLGCWFALELLGRPGVTSGFLLAPGTTAADVGASVAGAPLRWLVRLRPDEDVAALDAERLAREVRAPVLLFGSRRDAVMTPEFQERIRAAIPRPDARLVLLDDVTHGGFLRSERVWGELAPFLLGR